MPEPTPKPESFESQISHIQDSATRRALRFLEQEVNSVVARQQMLIDALLEMMLEKHMGSMGEFKRHLVRLQQDQQRGQRIHDALASAASHAPASAAGLHHHT